MAVPPVRKEVPVATVWLLPLMDTGPFEVTPEPLAVTISGNSDSGTPPL
jgi:hypothetical protein